MSDIKAGDLVMCVKPSSCCGSTKGIGQVATVIEIFDTYQTCDLCKQEFYIEKAIFGQRPEGRTGTVERERVIKLNPPSSPESIVEHEEIAA